MSRYYNRAGHPISLEEWAKALETDRRVAETYVPGYCISTVWLGLDHGFGGVPKFFETMVFAATDNKVTSFSDLDGERYASEDEALKGHETMVDKWSRVPITPQDGDSYDDAQAANQEEAE